jgi:HEAT repeat protein
MHGLDVEPHEAREACARALGFFGALADVATPRLKVLLHSDEDGFVRSNAAIALGEIQQDEMESVLSDFRRALGDEDLGVQLAVVQTLAFWGREIPRDFVDPLLRCIFYSTDSRVARDATKCLHRMGGGKLIAVQALAVVATSSGVSSRKRARAVGSLGLLALWGAESGPRVVEAEAALEAVRLDDSPSGVAARSALQRVHAAREVPDGRVPPK